jgi:hypothetical protein
VSRHGRVASVRALSFVQATDTIEKWGGRAPKTFEEFVLERKAEFSAKAA